MEAIMADVSRVTQVVSGRVLWNKGKIVGAKPPLRPKHVWSIRTKLQVEGRVRDLALFNFAIDSKLRGCDVVTLKVDDIAPGGYAVDRATVRQKKTGRPVKFELTETTRQAIDDYLKATGKRPGDYLFTGPRAFNVGLTTRQYARLLAEWVAGVGLDHIFSERTRCVGRRQRYLTAILRVAQEGAQPSHNRLECRRLQKFGLALHERDDIAGPQRA
jgi:integrase